MDEHAELMEALQVISQNQMSVLEHMETSSQLALIHGSFLEIIAAGIWTFIGVYMWRLIILAKNQRSLL